MFINILRDSFKRSIGG